MNALIEWAFKKEDGSTTKRGTGNITKLAKHLGMSQPAATKLIQREGQYNIKYAEDIMVFTGIPAEELFPAWFQIIEVSEAMKKNQKDQRNIRRKKEIEKLEKEME